MSSKLYFTYATMNSGKSMQLISRYYSFKQRGINTLVIKSALDTRDCNVIKSRAMQSEVPCFTVSQDTDILEWFRSLSDLPFETDKTQWILVDESQFLTAKQVEQLASIVDDYNVSVICYGLRTDFTGHLFEGSKRLFELADTIEEIKSSCSCGEKTIFNARMDSTGHLTVSGEQVSCGGEDKYITLCRACYNKAIAENLTVDELQHKH